MNLNFISQPLLNLIAVFYHVFGDLGVAIIVFTLFIRLVLTPLKMMQKMKQYGSELEKIKQKHKGDKQKQMQAQRDFYKEKGINPVSGCLPQIINMVILIALFSGFNSVFRQGEDVTANLNRILYPALKIQGQLNQYFLGHDLTRPDTVSVSGLPFAIPGLFLIVVAFVQFLSSKMMMPNVEVAEKVAKKTEGEADDIAASMQKQMIYMFPLMTLIIGLKFPLGVVVFWGAQSLFQGIQQYFVSGWGGLTPLVRKFVRS